MTFEIDDLGEKWDLFIKSHDKIKGYSHFDERTSLKTKSIRNYVADRVKIAKHAFYPFIHYTQITNKPKIKDTGIELKKKFRQIYYCSHKDRCVFQQYAFLMN